MDKDELIKDLFEALDEEVIWSDHSYKFLEKSIKMLEKCERLGYGRSKALAIKRIKE